MDDQGVRLPAGIAAPVRDTSETYTCRCVLIRPDVFGGGAQYKDMCGWSVAGPDQPFCEGCEENHQNEQAIAGFAEAGITVTFR